MKFTIPKLTFDTKKFDPSFYNEETFHEHLNFHHVAYVTKLNSAVETAKISYPLVQLLKESIYDTNIDQDIRTMIKNHGGGHYNHSLFWLCMSPEKTSMSDELKEKISSDFGSYESFINMFKESALKVFGSGWTWLVYKDNKLSIINTPNQDSPISENYSAILCIDVWEHAYYLVYKHDRKSFIDKWCEFINWKNVSEFYSKFAKNNVPVEIDYDGSVKK